MPRMDRVSSNNTAIMQENGETIVILHHTPVVRFNSDRTVLDSGGWRTATTKTRMNQASRVYGLGYTVFQRDHAWYVDDGKDVRDFYDGIEVGRG